MKTAVVSALLCCLFCLPRVSAQPPTALRPFKTAEPPLIDGILDDAVWTQAPVLTDFTGYYPEFGRPLSQRTRVWYAYDRENLYFAFRCFDTEPHKIKASVSARDKIKADDWICLNIDTFNDQQALYGFYVNPLGIQEDSRAIGANEDVSMDFVWYSRGRIDEKGYSIEVRIPLKSIRYAHADPVTMGIIFERRISRTSEQGTFPALSPEKGANFNTQMIPVIYEGLTAYRLMELLPAATWGRTRRKEASGWNTLTKTQDLSLTAKLGITPSLVLDGTVNPDFSQVEADAGQVDFNQRFALFYPEKRPFFLEGRENFSFGGAAQGDPLESLVHTRTIVNPRIGLKFTGKAGDKNTLASIYALDDAPGRPDAHVAVLRYKRSLSSDGYMGGFMTAREESGRGNRTGGFDGHFRLTPASTFGFHAFVSHTDDETAADPVTGHAVGATYGYADREWNASLHAADLSDAFTTGTGYLTRQGITRMQGAIVRHLFPSAGPLQRVDPRAEASAAYDKASALWEWDQSISLVLLMPRSTTFFAGYSNATEIFLGRRFGRSRVKLRFWSQLTKQLHVNVRYDYGKKIRYADDPFQGSGQDASFSCNYQPSEKFQSVLTCAYSDMYDQRDDKVFDYIILRSRNTYQINRYLFFRVIAEYNDFYERLITDALVSFTWVPGTVIHAGYGSIFERSEWRNERLVPADGLHERQQGLFFKASYMWRL